MKTNKIFIFLLLGLFFISFSSAADWDNSLRYENGDMKVILENAWGLPLFGSELGSVELKSHKTPTEIRRVGYGKEEVVMYYDFSGWDTYENGLGNVYFIDKNTGEEITKDYYFVELVSEEYEVFDYNETCDRHDNKTNYCFNQIIGTHKEKRDVWKRLDSRDIPDRDIRIGLKTYVEKGDYIDAIWTIAGEEISKHSSWTSSLNVDLIAYYPFEEGIGTTSEDVTGNGYDLTGVNTPGWTTSGKIGNATSAANLAYHPLVKTLFA